MDNPPNSNTTVPDNKPIDEEYHDSISVKSSEINQTQELEEMKNKKQSSKDVLQTQEITKVEMPKEESQKIAPKLNEKEQLKKDSTQNIDKASISKETSPSTTSIPSEKNYFLSASNPKLSRKIDICYSNSQLPQTETYAKKVESLRREMEFILSKWIMSARDYVGYDFYNSIRQSFESFLQEIENYQQNSLSYQSFSVKKDVKKVPEYAPYTYDKKSFKTTKTYPKYSCSYPPPKYESKYHKDTNYEIKRDKVVSKNCLVNAIEMADNINSRLNNLLSMLSDCKQKVQTQTQTKTETHTQTQNRRKFERRPQPSILDKTYERIPASSDGVDHLLAFIEKKLRKYKEKYGRYSRFAPHETNKIKTNFSKKYNLETVKQEKKKNEISHPYSYNEKETKPDNVKVAVWMRTLSGDDKTGSCGNPTGYKRIRITRKDPDPDM